MAIWGKINRKTGCVRVLMELYFMMKYQPKDSVLIEITFYKHIVCVNVLSLHFI